MKVCLIKCANKGMHNGNLTNEDFTHNHYDIFGRQICDWCWGMWGE